MSKNDLISLVPLSVSKTFNWIKFPVVSPYFDSPSKNERTSTLRLIGSFKLTVTPTTTLTAPRNGTRWNVPFSVFPMTLVLVRLATPKLASRIGETRDERQAQTRSHLKNYMCLPALQRNKEILQLVSLLVDAIAVS